MKYYVTLKNKTYEVEVEDGEATLLSETDVAGAPAAAKTSAHASKAPVVPAAPSATSAIAAPVTVPTVPPASNAVAAEAGAVVSPMPGSILDIRVAEGQSVSAGDVVLILEAMKMENEIVATASGVVRKILVTKGQSVQTGASLLVIG